MVALQVVGEAEQAEAGDPRRPKAGRSASFNGLPECGLALLRLAEPEQGGTKPRVGDTVPGRFLVCTQEGGLARRSAGSEVAELPGVHSTEAVRCRGTRAEPVVEHPAGGRVGRSEERRV